MKTLNHAWKYNRIWLLGLLSAPVLLTLILHFASQSAGFAASDVWREPWVLAIPLWGGAVVLTGLFRYYFFINDNPVLAAKTVQLFDYGSLALALVTLVTM